MPITLPLEPTEATEKNPKLLVLYGQQKIGKTTICSKLESLGKYLIHEYDRRGKGANFIRCNRYPITSYDEHNNLCIEIIKQGRPYKFGIMDTASTFEDLCEIDATQQYTKSNAGKSFTGRSVLELVGPDYNPGYRWLRLSFQLAMAKMYDAYEHVIVICHMKDKYLKTEVKDKGKSDSNVSAAEIDLSGKLRSMLMTAADASGFLYRTINASGEQKLWVSFETSEVIGCGSRCEHLIQKKFEFDWSKIYI